MARLDIERFRALNSWHADWAGLRIAVLGLGVSGFAAADTLCELGCRVRVYDENRQTERERLLAVIGAEFFCGSIDEQVADIAEYDPEIIIVSPGYARTHPLLMWADEEQIKQMSEIDLAWRLRDKTGQPAKWLCLTGTNGKTTTAQLAAHMLVAGGLRAAPVGNIGTPVLDAIRDPQGFDVLVVELSSFQLHRVQDIEPHATAVLNIADDHLDWHGGFAEYVAAKAKIYERTRVACIYNRAEPITENMVAEADVFEGCRAVSFGLDTPPVAGFGVVEGILVDRGYHDDRRNCALEICSIAELESVGLASAHMVQNILAAAALVRAVGVSPQAIAQAVLNFQPDRHRSELIAQANDVVWINDSKATNAHAAAAALRAYESVVWIVGGLLKGADLSALVRDNAKRLRAVVVIGESRAHVLEALKTCAPAVPVVEVLASQSAAVMAEAVAAAGSMTKPGDTVLLAPAAASMDQFKNYADRGEHFVAAVKAHLG